MGSAVSSAGRRFSVAGSRSASSRSASEDWRFWCSSSCRRRKDSRSSLYGWPYSACTWARHSRLTTSACRWCRPKLGFLRRQVLMSRNISGGSLISVFMGGLNYQIEHHLFPSMARPYLRKAQPLVSAYCAAQSVPYTRTTLWQSYRIVIGYLNSVGLRGKDPFLCPMVAQRRALQPHTLRDLGYRVRRQVLARPPLSRGVADPRIVRTR
jgi:hypothetical protein